MAEEIRFFIRTATFALLIAVVYWFHSYELLGTILLGGFGVAATFVAAAFVHGLLAHGWRPSGRPLSWLGLSGGPRTPIGDEPTRYPAPGCAPLACGAGLALAVLGAVYGPPPIVIAIPFLAFGGWSWLRSAMAEYRAVEADGGEVPQD